MMMMAKTVLLVDDSRVARMLARAAIERIHSDWSIVEATSGEEALALAKAAAPDFILVDVNMPGIGGLAAAGLLREMCPAAGISLLTANIQDPVRQQAEGMGVGFLTKPVREDKLLAFLDGEASRP
jgi:CheY-like chemotaxis protein